MRMSKDFMKIYDKQMKWVFALIVILAVSAVFAPALRGEFLHWDDDGLFVYNPYFRGLDAEHLKWMRTTFWYGHWQPISWLSFALDFAAWGMNPHGWHATSLLLHSINAVLVYLLCLAFLKEQRASYAISALAALSYAIHPLRVEAVVWLATRGYLLCGTFCLLTMLFYLKTGKQKRYPFAALLCFTFATVTKGIGMMLPLVLLLIDWGHFRRITSVRTMLSCVIEKTPFFVLSLLTGIMAFLAKKTGGGMMPVEKYGVIERFGQAVYGIWFYLFKTVLPLNLTPLYYKQPEVVPVVVALALTSAAAISLFLLRHRVRPVLITSGAFLIMIFPMIGFTQSGVQFFADRFTYLAAIPFSVLLAVGLSRLKTMRRLICGALAVLLTLFGVQTFAFSNTWSHNLSLWWCAASVDKNNAEAYNSAGLALMDYQYYEKALEYFEKAVQLKPGYALAVHNRALALAMMGRYDEAFRDWEIALALPDVPKEAREKILWVRGWVFEQTGNLKDAENDYSSVADDNMTTPMQRADILQLRAALYLRTGQKEKALADLETVLKLPDPFGKQRQKAQEKINEINRIKED
jgi:Tfp pilus assembly protein PilF